MHLKKFVLVYLLVLVFGLLILSINDIRFIIGSESQLSQVSHHVPGGSQTYYKLGGKYEEKTLKPVFEYSVDGTRYSFVPDYACKEGCHPVGSQVTLFYQKDKPQVALVSSFAGMWKYKIYFMIIMGVLLVTALPYLYYHTNKRPVS